MARTVKDYMDIVKQVRDNIPNETESIVNRNKLLIIKLNTSQIVLGLGSDDNKLINDNPIFSGKYTKTTELIAKKRKPIAPKKAGELYNFTWNGDFYRGFNFKLKKLKIYFFSTGTGANEKKDFFDGYKNIFGLNKDNQEKLNEKILKPALWKYLKRYL